MWNGLTNEWHPQILADIFTMSEHHGPLEEIAYCFLGDGRRHRSSTPNGLSDRAHRLFGPFHAPQPR